MLKAQKGITLVALVITIIVLIILAGVSISAAMNDGLIKNSKKAREDYKNAADEENYLIHNLMDQYNDVTNGWVNVSK